MKCAALAFALGVLLVSGCSGGFSGRSAASTGILRVALEHSVVTYDPGRVQDPEAIEMLGNIYDPLVGYNEHNEIEPRLAESYEATDGGRVWTFHLRKGVKFHNGREMTAGDVKWTLERNLRKSFASPVAFNYLSGILGAKELSEGTADSLKGVEVVDDSTVKITLIEPRAYFLGQITYPCAFVLAKEAAGDQEITDLKQMIGTGPFKVDKILPDQLVSLTANADYFLGKPKLSKIEQPLVIDPVTRLNMYKKGQLDILAVDRASLAGVKADKSLVDQLQTRPQPTVFYIGLNQHLYKPFQSLKVRQAFAMAIDRKHIAEDLLGGVPEAHGLITPEVPGYRPNFQGVPYNPKDARMLLEEAGYPNGKGLPELEILYIESGPDSRTVVQGVQESLKKNTNWPVTLRALQPSVFFDKRNASKLPCWYLTWGADYPDPQNFTTFLLRSDSTMDYEGYRNAEFDRVGKLADTTLDKDKRLKLYQDAEDILMYDVARVPLNFQIDNILVSPKVKDLRMNLMGNLPHVLTDVK
ncbi:ABC transporter substrate-binding protein [soil metagenome]